MTTRREYTAKDVEQINEAELHLRARGLDEENQRIVDLIDQYFQANLTVAVTAVNVIKLVEAQPGLKWLSPAELEYRRIAAENPEAAEKLADWFATQGRPGTLVNTGDLYFQNASNLLQELRGRDVNSATIDRAIGRIGAPTSKFSTRKRPPLHFVHQSRPQDPRQHQADGTGFLGTNLNEPHWKRVQREREARDAANHQSEVSAQSVVVCEAQQKAEQLRGNTHSESEQLARLFVTTPGTSEIDWPNTLAARLNLQNSLNKAQEVRRFIR